ncbi:MAG: sigma-54-dependent Fis family transcriptional regulator [Deltaproteobacteria bacterium]|nr:sigma-54-dependent Fis family transcriptional regulator [Deltaproteobacteria bacterium]
MSNSSNTKKYLALIVDDEKSICDTLAGVLSDEGWESVSAYTGKDGLDIFKKQPVDLVFLDVWMKKMDGIQALQKMKEIREDTLIVVMSGHGNIETAVKATKLGAFDFLEKPLSLEKILPILDHIETKKKEEKEPASVAAKGYELIGISDDIASVHRQIKMIARRNSWVLITGENGTGKEVVARNIHLQSLRADKNFVAVNCAAIPEELIESELFGYTKGAFTHAIQSKMGKFELAHHGTLFLDEIGDMSLKTQAKILRILQEQSFQRLGDNKTISVDVRVVAATNKNLQEEIERGSFREDLFYRLKVIPIHMTPLRDRNEDIPVLCQHFLSRTADEFGEETKAMSEEALEFFRHYHWPGNARELKNMIERLCIMVPGTTIKEDDVRELIAIKPGQEEQGSSMTVFGDTLKEARSRFEKSFIIDKLEENEWNISKTAEAIGLERSNLHRKMRLYDIELKRRRLQN